MTLLKSILLISLVASILNAKDTNPKFTYMAKGAVTDLVYSNNKLYVATASSSVDIFDIKTQKQTNSIALPKIKDFMGDVIDSKVYSIDILDDSILILSQGSKGGRAINIYKDGKLKELISAKKRMFIARAKFVSKDKIIFALLSNEVYLFDLKTKKNIYIKQMSQSKFSSFTLDEKKKNILVCDESGVLHLMNINSGKVVQIFKNQNLDNVFQTDLKNNIILTAGQDRRAVVYDMKKDSNTYYKKTPFLIYSAGLTPSANIAGIAYNENNEVLVFNTKTKKELHILKKNKTTLSNILFINEKEVFVSSDAKEVNYYKID